MSETTTPFQSAMAKLAAVEKTIWCDGCARFVDPDPVCTDENLCPDPPLPLTPSEAAAIRERLEQVNRLRGALGYIREQAISSAYGENYKLALSVIERNAEAALNDGFQSTLKAALASLQELPND